jgi:hypothetical protein
MSKVRPVWKVGAGVLVLGVSLVLFSIHLRATGRGCPHQGSDARLLAEPMCWLQRHLTIENAQTPTHIWSLDIAKVSLRIDPRHPHLLIEWPAESQKLWRFRIGYRWDANARAYIFPAVAFKKVDGPMKEYQIDRGAAQ